VTASKVAISTSSSDLLDIVLNRAGNIVVNNRLDVTLVDTHGESNSADKDASSVLYKVLLNNGPLRVEETSVICSSFDTILVQELCKLLGRSSLSGKDKDRG